MVVSSSSSDGGIGCEPAPVMGALSNWPALSETRNVKAPEPIKTSSSAQQKTPLKDSNSQVPLGLSCYQNFSLLDRYPFSFSFRLPI